MSDLQDNFHNLSAVLDILQNNAHPAQRPVLRLVGDHLRLLALCMDLPARCSPHMPPSGAGQSARDSSDPGRFARLAAQTGEARYVRQ
ncbi:MULTISPECIES: hypothetical protein [Desulfovibrio]|uniref:Uncharacterized protein n=1 Tax=Desulfovibrio desulfuricans TaxID=876 RepID=A0AA94HVE4_DESDE|nr:MULTISPECIES: hypothetical protein [Desulfovibrio]ATD81786.1 hypothetical protein CNY67_10635 [Desulfovibrio sp. G11]SFW69339.1 hypothetical protein SAMN02910291_02547 [Desulfovibrio desulfuricans]SPD34517.1 Hypothetical protein DSVG11_0392 [Desulfovibrio sp. G11]